MDSTEVADFTWSTPWDQITVDRLLMLFLVFWAVAYVVQAFWYPPVNGRRRKRRH